MHLVALAHLLAGWKPAPLWQTYPTEGGRGECAAVVDPTAWSDERKQVGSAQASRIPKSFSGLKNGITARFIFRTRMLLATLTGSWSTDRPSYKKCGGEVGGHLYNVGAVI